MYHNYGVISESHSCRDCVWLIILVQSFIRLEKNPSFFRFFEIKQDFVLFLKENGETLFLIVFIASCKISSFRITQL